METTVAQSSEALTRVAVMRAGSRLISHVFGVYDRVRNVQRFLHLFTELLFIVGGGASAPASWLRRDRGRLARGFVGPLRNPRSPLAPISVFSLLALDDARVWTTQADRKTPPFNAKLQWLVTQRDFLSLGKCQPSDRPLP